MSTIGGFSYDDAAEIKRRVLGNSSLQKPLDANKQHLGQRDKYYVRLEEDLDEATNFLTGYKQAQARIVRYKLTQDKLDMEFVDDDTNPPITITNRSTSFSALSGNTIQVHRIGSEWAPTHASGGANSTSDFCPCECIENGDHSVDGVETTYQFNISVGDLVFEIDNGTVVLPSGSYQVIWDDDRGLWVVDIGDELEAYWQDGTNVTGLSTLDGEITLTKDPNNSSEVKVCIDATIVDPSDINVPFQNGYTYGFQNGQIDGFFGNPYDDRVIYSGSTGTAAGTGSNQQFGTGTWLAPGTGTYGPGTGSGSGTAPWSDGEDAFYIGYRAGYRDGYYTQGPFYGTGSGT